MHQHVEVEGENQKSIAEALFHLHAPAIFAFLYQQSSSREDAEDILLDVFTAILGHKYLSGLTPEHQKALLWRIARNKLIDVGRYRSRRPSISIEPMINELFADAEQEPEEELLRLEEYAHLRALLQTLSPIQQKILKLRFVHEHHSPEIALLVGKSETAVRTTISRALNQLRKLYREGE